MTDRIITNEKYSQGITAYIDSITACIEETTQLAVVVLGKSFMSLDICFCGLMNRSIHLAQGFISMLRDRNLTCAGALLRLQLDNCLRLYAISIAEDEQAVIGTVLDGKSIRSLKDKSGKKMTDAYLKEQLGMYDKQLPIVYANTSGFIHFSGVAVFQSIDVCKEHRATIQIGGDLSEKHNGALIECAEAYLHYYRLFLNLMNGEAEWKQSFDKSMEEP